MTYIKQNFEDGQLLNAGHLNYIEDGIVENENKLSQLSEDKVNKPSVAGTAGQFLTSDGNGGTAWVSLPVYAGEVEDT